MSGDLIEYHGTAIATAAQVVAQTLRVQEILKAVMKQDVHYGVIPGTKKNTLYKPGAEILCAAFHIAPTYDYVEERFEDGVRYRVKCIGVHQGSTTVIAEGLGSCSSMEEKYKWRKTYSKREFGDAPADRKRLDYWYDKSAREEKEIMQVRVETADIENTLLKMASKRAMIAMVLNAVAASDVFAQDLEDLSEKVREHMTEDGEQQTTDKKPAFKEPQTKGTVDKATGEVTTNNGEASIGRLLNTSKRIAKNGWTLDEYAKHIGRGILTEGDCAAAIAHAEANRREPLTVADQA